MNSIANLSQEEFEKIEKFWFSKYPIIRYKANNFNNIKFEFENKKIEDLFNFFLSHNKCLNIGEFMEINEIFYNSLRSIFSNITSNVLTFFEPKDELIVPTFIELSKVYFPYNQLVDTMLYKYRYPILEEAYKKDTKLFWRHDGSWNCYYGEIYDTKGLKKLEKYYKERKKYSFLNQIKIILTYCYRLAEHNQIKKARKIMKKHNRFLFFNWLSNNILGRVYDLFIGNKFIFRLLREYESYRRFDLNMKMFLYKSEKNKSKKRIIINKLYRKNNLRSLYKKILFVRVMKQNLDNIYVNIRTQHLLKLTELRIDKYVLKPSKKLLNEIHFMLIKIINLIFIKNASNDNALQSFIMIEFFFVLFYYLENVYNINIQEY